MSAPLPATSSSSSTACSWPLAAFSSTSFMILSLKLSLYSSGSQWEAMSSTRRFGHLQLALVEFRLGDAFVQLQAIQAAHLRRPAQGDQHQGVLQRPQERQVLAGVQDDVGQGDLAGALQGLPEQRVDLASAPVGAR